MGSFVRMYSYYGMSKFYRNISNFLWRFIFTLSHLTVILELLISNITQQYYSQKVPEIIMAIKGASKISISLTNRSNFFMVNFNNLQALALLWIHPFHFQTFIEWQNKQWHEDKFINLDKKTPFSNNFILKSF